MCFCNNRCYCSRWQCPGSGGIIGPVGPRGPQGIPGPQGPSGISLLSSFVNPTATGIATVTAIPLLDNVNFNPKVTHAAGSPFVTLQPGTYFIQYGANATSATVGALNLAIQLNGTSLEGATATISDTTDTVNLKGQTVLTVATPSTINLVNAGANTTTYDNVDLVIQEVIPPTT